MIQCGAYYNSDICKCSGKIEEKLGVLWLWGRSESSRYVSGGLRHCQEFSKKDREEMHSIQRHRTNKTVWGMARVGTTGHMKAFEVF
jgi:hypothetical protein